MHPLDGKIALISGAALRIGAPSARVVANDALWFDEGVEQATPADWEKMPPMNRTGVFLGIKAVVPAFREHTRSIGRFGTLEDIVKGTVCLGSEAAPARACRSAAA